MTKLKADASRCLAAVEPVITSLSGVQQESGFKKVPAPLQKKAQICLRGLEEIKSAAKKIIEGTLTSALPCTIEDVKTRVKEGIRSRTTLARDPPI